MMETLRILFFKRSILLIVLLSFGLNEAFAADRILLSKIYECRNLLTILARGKISKTSPELENFTKAIHESLEGLKYNGIVPWSPREITNLNRKLVRYHNIKEFSYKLPRYKKNQKLGPATISANQIRFSQAACKNESEGGYSVIANAHAFKAGTLKPSDLPRLRVWKDSNDKIWTLDHRRLAAMRLSGVIEDVEVEFVAEEVVKSQHFKFDTTSQGQSILVQIKNKDLPDLAIILTNKELKQTIDNKSLANSIMLFRNVPIPNKGNEITFKKLLSNYPPKDRKAWQDTRGIAHFENLRSYAHDLANSLDAMLKHHSSDLTKAYSNFGMLSARAKSEDSILAKLLRKDFSAFQKGQKGINSLDAAVKGLGDAIGAKIILKSTDQIVDAQSIQKFVDKIVTDIKSGIRITEIMNYRARGPQGMPYLTDGQIQQIIRADQEYRIELKAMKDAGKNVEIPDPLIVKNGPEASFETGYTSFQMNIQYKSGIQLEVQVQGELIAENSEIQHFFYDLKSGKVLNEKLSYNPQLIHAEKIYQSLTSDEKKQIMDYVSSRLIHARQLENGITASPLPTLPSHLPQELSFENLKMHLINK